MIYPPSKIFLFFLNFLQNPGSESVVYEGILDGKKVAIKKPILSTSEDIDKFHKELQFLWFVLFIDFYV